MPKSKKKEMQNYKFPLVYMTGINYNDFNLYSEIDTCEDIKKFMNLNEFPIFKNFDSKYLFKLLRFKKQFSYLISIKKNYHHYRD